MPKTKMSFSSVLFGHDIFISFAMGQAPRGTQSYASDLARRLREFGYTVYFSEEVLPPGSFLTASLRRALHRSQALVVIVNRATMADPRWVRIEVEFFRAHHPKRTIAPINIAGALQDPEFSEPANVWLKHHGTVWLDEAEDAAANGIASESLVNRLALVPTAIRRDRLWNTAKLVIIIVLLTLTGLVFRFGITAQSRANKIEEQNQELLGRNRQIRGKALVTAAREAISEDTSLSLLLARRACDTLDNAETHQMLRESLRAFPLVAHLKGHTNAITAIAVSPEGNSIATASADGSVHLWDPSGISIGILQGHTSEITSLAFDHDGKSLLTASQDNTARLWNLDGKTLAIFQGHRAVTNQLIEVGSKGETRGGQISALAGACFSRDGKKVLTASADGTARIWSRFGQQEAVLNHGQSVREAQFSSDGTKVLTASGGGDNLKLWNVSNNTPKLQTECKHHNNMGVIKTG